MQQVLVFSRPRFQGLARYIAGNVRQNALKMDFRPFRNGELLKEQLAQHPDKVFYYEGTERDIQRNQDNV